MLPLTMTRRELINLTAKAAAVATAGQFFAKQSFGSEEVLAIDRELDAFVERYMREMNAPGMTLALADKEGIRRITTYGFSDVKEKIRVQVNELFQIGSISKSFVAICLLHLNDEGKLDLHKPILEYLPWLKIESTFAPITSHHLLSHSAGLPDSSPVFHSDPSGKHRAAYAPGTKFHYCNLGFDLLGYLIWTIEKKPLSEVIRKRIFGPLGMNQSEPALTLDMFGRTVKSYSVSRNDQPFTRDGALVYAQGRVFDGGSGSIASTPHDMGLYLKMIANECRGLLSKESFGLFSKAHIGGAEEFGPTASYGYGIAVDTLDGHKVAIHKGGTASFACAMHIDLDAGVGAFASINAMQGFRPNPVAEYAIRLMRAKAEKRAFPKQPDIVSARVIENASDYAGTYKNEKGDNLNFLSVEQSLYLQYKGLRVPVETIQGEGLIIRHPDFERFALFFSRRDPEDPKSPVVEVGFGNDWYVNEKYLGPKHFDLPIEWKGFIGHYRNNDPDLGSIHIVARKGRLLVDGNNPLVPIKEDKFQVLDEPQSPEWIQFGNVVNGCAMTLKFSGLDFWRVMVD